MPPSTYSSDFAPVEPKQYPIVELRQGRFVEVKHRPGERKQLNSCEKNLLRKQRKAERQRRKHVRSI